MTEPGTRVAIRGVRPYDGEYELDLRRAWTTHEWNWIKRISGYMPFTISEGLKGGDPALVVALAVIGMVRNGKVDRDDAMTVADRLLDVPYDGAAIQLVIEDEQGDASPPDLTSAPDESSPNGTRSENKPFGASSKTSSDRSDENPLPTGTTESGWPGTSELQTLVTQPPVT